jgi:hypothetical protein
LALAMAGVWYRPVENSAGWNRDTVLLMDAIPCYWLGEQIAAVRKEKIMLPLIHQVLSQ